MALRCPDNKILPAGRYAVHRGLLPHPVAHRVIFDMDGIAIMILSKNDSLGYDTLFLPFFIKKVF